jgi:preprotein translocase subunit SecG
MNFKSATCPSCGGNLQLPDNLVTAKCMYCGVDVIVQEAIQLSGRVKDFTQARKVFTNIAIENSLSNNAYYTIIFIMGIFFFLISLGVGIFTDKTVAVIIGIFFAIILIVTLVKNIKEQKEISQKLIDEKPADILIAY